MGHFISNFVKRVKNWQTCIIVVIEGSNIRLWYVLRMNIIIVIRPWIEFRDTVKTCFSETAQIMGKIKAVITFLKFFIQNKYRVTAYFAFNVIIYRAGITKP